MFIIRLVLRLVLQRENVSKKVDDDCSIAHTKLAY